MNTSEQNIIQTVKSIRLMNDSLEAVCTRTLPANPQLFALLSEGPINQTRDLLNQLDKLIAEAASLNELMEEHALDS